jgi:hypothetical protein
MPATTTSETWTARWALTKRRQRRRRVTDNIADEFPLIRYMRGQGRIEIERGGKEFKEDLMYELNTGQWFSGYDELDDDAVDGITSAFFLPRYNQVPVTISETEDIENQARDGMRLLDAKDMQSDVTLMSAVNTAAFGAQSGKSMLGLQDIIADAPTTGTVGGINRATNSWWRNQTNASGGDFDAKSGDIYTGLSSMSAMFNDCSEGNVRPRVIFTTLTLFGELETILESTGYARLEAGSREAGVDASAPSFRGAPVVFDRDCASGHMYFINPQYLKLKVMNRANFTTTPFKDAPKQWAKVAYKVFGGNLITNNPRRLGVVQFT